MDFIWKQDEWAIHRSKARSVKYKYCLRHMCKDAGIDGCCACGEYGCYSCKTKAPDEILGFFELVKWER